MALRFYLRKLETGTERWRGGHCENGLLLTLFHLLCFDSLFLMREGDCRDGSGSADDIDDGNSANRAGIFFSPYQPQPFEMQSLPHCFVPVPKAGASAVHDSGSNEGDGGNRCGTGAALVQLRQMRSSRFAALLSDLREGGDGKGRAQRLRRRVRYAWAQTHRRAEAEAKTQTGREAQGKRVHRWLTRWQVCWSAQLAAQT